MTLGATKRDKFEPADAVAYSKLRVHLTTPYTSIIRCIVRPIDRCSKKR